MILVVRALYSCVIFFVFSVEFAVRVCSRLAVLHSISGTHNVKPRWSGLLVNYPDTFLHLSLGLYSLRMPGQGTVQVWAIVKTPSVSQHARHARHTLSASDVSYAEVSNQYVLSSMVRCRRTVSQVG